jgi:hypothetical protein
MLERSGVAQTIGEEHISLTIEDGVQAFNSEGR